MLGWIYLLREKVCERRVYFIVWVWWSIWTIGSVQDTQVSCLCRVQSQQARRQVAIRVVWGLFLFWTKRLLHLQSINPREWSNDYVYRDYVTIHDQFCLIIVNLLPYGRSERILFYVYELRAWRGDPHSHSLGRRCIHSWVNTTRKRFCLSLIIIIK